MGELYAGLLQPVLHFESLLPILALALWAAQQGVPLLWQLPITFAGAALVAACVALFGFALPGAVHVQSAAMLGFGGLAARVRLRPRLRSSPPSQPRAGQRQRLRRPAAAAVSVLGFARPRPAAVPRQNSRARRAFWMQVGIRVVGAGSRRWGTNQRCSRCET
jgi:hypothetical protein